MPNIIKNLPKKLEEIEMEGRNPNRPTQEGGNKIQINLEDLIILHKFYKWKEGIMMIKIFSPHFRISFLMIQMNRKI